MKLQNLFLIIITSISCAYLYAAPAQQSNSQGKSMLKTDEVLDLSTFTQGPKGILYKIVTPAPANASKPARGEQVEVHYAGCNLKILNGIYTITNEFDSSYLRGRPFMLQVGANQVIEGWELMIADMKEGERRIVILPPAVAYGARGAGQAIFPNATLVFDMHLIKIR